MPFVTLLLTLFQLIVIALLIVWWLRWTTRGLEWVVVAFLAALGLSYLSGQAFRVPPYQAGCAGICAGWQGFPLPTYHLETGNIVLFDAVSFVRNALIYYALFLSFSGFIAWLAVRWRWPRRSWLQRAFFVLMTILLPLAMLPLWASPPEPEMPLPEKRLAVNAANDWRWQLHLRDFMDRRLALEDIRPLPDNQGYRVCFRVYTWFYLPYRHVYIDLEPTGVRATHGATIPLSDSCWTQP